MAEDLLIKMLVYWILTAGLMIIFLGIIGKAINERWSGILINELNVMSLSRLQIVIWTVIILSAYLTATTARIYSGHPDPLGIVVDWQIWALLGISSTSLVATPIILDNKKKKTTTTDAITTYAYSEENMVGIAFRNSNDTDAKFTDMFEGDEVGNEKYVDMSKVQMFFFTIISALSYIILLFKEFLGNIILDSLPTLPEGLIAILTISHGAYLSYKIVNHTPDAS